MKEVEKLDNESIEFQCQRILNNKPLPWFYDSYQELLLNDFYEEFVVYNDVLYSVLKEEIDMDEDIFIAKVNKNGDIDFEVKYYNGGCGFEEAIEEAIDKLNNYKK